MAFFTRKSPTKSTKTVTGRWAFAQRYAYHRLCVEQKQWDGDGLYFAIAEALECQIMTGAQRVQARLDQDRRRVRSRGTGKLIVSWGYEDPQDAAMIAALDKVDLSQYD